MHSIIRLTMALGFAAALGIATAAPTFAQEPTSPTETRVGPTPPAGPGFANVNTPGPNGQCWKMTNSDLGYGYWGECAAAPRVVGRAHGRAHAAHARAEPTSPTATNLRPTPAGPGFASVNTPGPNGQCWKMTNADLGYGYWGECAAGAQATAGARRQARRY